MPFIGGHPLCTVRAGALKLLSNRGPARGSRVRLEPRLAVVGAQSLGTRLVKKIGDKKATVAVARKLAVILHWMRQDAIARTLSRP